MDFLDDFDSGQLLLALDLVAEWQLEKVKALEVWDEWAEWDLYYAAHVSFTSETSILITPRRTAPRSPGFYKTIELRHRSSLPGRSPGKVTTFTANMDSLDTEILMAVWVNWVDEDDDPDIEEIMYSGQYRQVDCREEYCVSPKSFFIEQQALPI